MGFSTRNVGNEYLVVEVKHNPRDFVEYLRSHGSESSR